MSELHKWNAHHRQQLALHFWRDHKGREIDLLVDMGNQVVAVEIKSGATLSRDFFRGLEYYQSLAQEHLRQSYLIYGGDQSQTRAAGIVLPWSRISTLTDSLAVQSSV